MYALMMRLIVLLGILAVTNAVWKSEIPTPKERTPIILVPGDGGSRVYVKLQSPSLICPGNKDWSLIWLNAEFLVLEYCFPRYFKLNYNRTDRKTYDPAGVQTQIKYWGETTAVEMLDSSPHDFARYFIDTVNMLVERANYTRGKDVRGAPYDFRRAPNDNADFFPKLKALVEDTYKINGNKRVMLLAHSLGNLYVLHFLKMMSPQWKKKYVRSYVAASAPIGGSVKPLVLETCGDKLNPFVPSRSYMREVERAMPSTAFLMPSPVFWKDDEVLVSRPGRNYTVNDYQQLFKDMNYPDGWEMYKDTSKIFDPLWAPDLDEVYCIHGGGIPTGERLVWKSDKDFPDSEPEIITGFGDGTVNQRSLYACRHWPNVKWSEIEGAGHMGILRNPQFLLQLYQVVGKKDILQDERL